MYLLVESVGVSKKRGGDLRSDFAEKTSRQTSERRSTLSRRRTRGRRAYWSGAPRILACHILCGFVTPPPELRFELRSQLHTLEANHFHVFHALVEYARAWYAFGKVQHEQSDGV